MEEASDKGNSIAQRRSMSLRDRELHNKDTLLDDLIEAGVKGHFPLFYPEWLPKCIRKRQKRSFTSSEKKIVRDVFARIDQHRDIDRKRTILLTLGEEERKLFVRAFLGLVEARLISKKIKIH